MFCSLQYHLPPKGQVNKDFLKQVFAEEKHLMRKAAVVHIEVSRYDEVSVKRLRPSLSKDKKFMQFFPDDFAESRGPSREYFFNILSTLYPDYLVKITAHANKERYSATGEGMKNESIQISESWQEQPKSMPYLSCK